ncbi:MAG: uroporphyrinogen decarboxylase family protein [Spirochaetota bacterium]
MGKSYDYTLRDAMAMPVTQVDPAGFDIPCYEDYAAACDGRFAGFMGKKEGIAVWQRVRAGEVFRDACRDMKESLRWQLGCLQKSLLYLSDAPTYLEPWYGIGTVASAFGAEYEWAAKQAPAVRPLYRKFEEVPDLIPLDYKDVPIMKYTLQTIDYFLEQSQGRLPLSWCDIQDPINVVGGLIDMGEFLMALYEEPDRAKKILAQIGDVLVDFTQTQSRLIGKSLVQPGHGFASSRLGTGIALSTDNAIMLSPAMFEEFCLGNSARIGQSFGGTVFHSCGNWGRWIESVKKMPNLLMVDGAFSPETDPGYNKCEEFRDALAGTGIILHARIVGDADEVLSRVKRLWKPGLRLIVGTHVQDPGEQNRLYHDIHGLCA